MQPFAKYDHISSVTKMPNKKKPQKNEILLIYLYSPSHAKHSICDNNLLVKRLEEKYFMKYFLSFKSASD